jgi:hypothetical protein
MNAIAETMPAAPLGTEDPLNGVEAEMNQRRRQSREQIEKAASELGDRPGYYISYGELTPEFAKQFYEQNRAEDTATIRRHLLLLAASGLALMLAILYVKSNFSTPSSASVATAFAIVLIPILGMAAFAFLLAAIFKSFFDWGSKADFIEMFGDKAARTWGVGSKAIYAVSNGDLQVIRLDAVGSVELLDDGRLVVSSRFGDSTVTFREARADGISPEELAEDLRRRIQ